MALGAAAGIQLLGAALDLPQAVMDISPFTHLPDRPADNLPVTTWLWLTAVTTLLITAGLSTVRQRDLR